MESISITNARQQLYRLAEQTVESSEPIRITSKSGDVIMISASDYSAMQETVHLLSIQGLRESLLLAKAEPLADGADVDAINWDDV